MKKNTHGGARKGAGRKRKEPTVVMRIPQSLVEIVKKLISNKTMKNVILILALSIVFLACSEDDAPTKSTVVVPPPFAEVKAPFTNFWFSTKFNVPARETTEFNELAYYNSWAYLNEEYPTDEFNYWMSQKEVLQTGSSLKIDLKQASLNIVAQGTIPRNGSVLPAGFTGKASAWPENFTYKLTITADPVNLVVNSAKLELTSGAFNISYDITQYMDFQQYDKYAMPEWSINNTSDSFLDFEKIRIAVVFDDVVGTAIKK
jgi:hypothetical protein